MNSKDQISLTAAVCIGIGGMVGAGIFSILGVVAQAAGNAMWLSFLVGGFVALLSTYSYAKLGAKYPSAGGAVEFLIQGFGKGTLSGGMNLFMWVGYIISLALYAQGFSAYAATFISSSPSPLLNKSLASGIVILFTAVNMRGARSVGRSETFIVAVKVSILILFAGAGLFFIHSSNLSPSLFPGVPDILFGAGVLFIGYEGFGLVCNAAANMDNPVKTLPKALYISVFSVIIIYLAVSITVLGNLPLKEIYSSRDYALAEAAKPFLGTFGFKLIAVAALFSTASAINATLFGGANVSYTIARDGELPEVFAHREWRGATGGLLITALLVIIFILFFDLAGIAMMGSGAFLIVYASVNAGHIRIIKNTGANLLLVWLSLIMCIAMLIVLEIYTWQNSREAVYTMFLLLFLSFAGEWLWKRKRSKNMGFSQE